MTKWGPEMVLWNATLVEIIFHLEPSNLEVARHLLGLLAFRISFVEIPEVLFSLNSRERQF
jgi:hypothetical protein